VILLVSEKSARNSALRAWIRALDHTKFLNDEPAITLAALIDDCADTHGDCAALLGEGEQFSYQELAARSNQYARWAVSQGLNVGDVVCLLMPNRPEYVATWLGVTRVGCAVALINTNVVADSLLHSIRAAGSTHLIVANTLLPAVVAVADRLPSGTRIWVHGGATAGSWPQIELELERLSGAPLGAEERPLPALQDRALLIYTSGTTGLPKAANVTHQRVLEWSFWFAGMMDAQPSERLYNCLPMYHSIGGIVAIGAMLVKGGSVLIRSQFSASHFWDDVVDGHCTIFQYIGELCRYLMRSPPHPKERQHKLRLACGNGLQGNVWKDFQERFGIPQILEFYAATEGVVSLYNCEGKRGAIGRIPSFLAHRFPVALIRFDPETGALLRDAAGLCIACTDDEAGEAIGQISAPRHSATRRFDGYTDTAAAEFKVLHDVFAKGDRWFRTGDLLRKDSAGYFYFVDRIGDTFRWRGENVSTNEVAEVLRACPGVTDAVVYGVTMRGYEGRAGMAAISTDDRFDFDSLRTHLVALLPTYAHPLFIRCCDTLDVTGTFKLTKGKLTAEGYNNANDPVWFNDRDMGRFVVCDAALLQSINNGVRRL
jgi:fatty-acyl-CoA synthase